jgi:hypothetical protein
VSDILRIAFLALAIVMSSMVLLMGVFEALRRLGVRKQRATAADATAATFDPALLAVLSAAVAEALGRRVRIHRVQARHGAADRWSRAGRMDVMVSHRVGPTR